MRLCVGLMIIIYLYTLLVATVASFAPLAHAAQARALPFQPGERLEFALRWEALPAGQATLEVLPLSAIDGAAAYHFKLTARTTPFIDTIYRVRDQIEGWTDLDLRRSLRYHKDQQEGDRMRNIVVRFDWRAQTAQYTNFDHRREPIAVQPETLDPLSAFYFTRMAIELREGASIERPVTDGRKHVRGTARVLRRETVSVPAGTFETVLIEPDLKDVGGVFRKSPGARIFIWMTDDERRIPVKLQSRVVIGRFVGELVSMANTRGEPSPAGAKPGDS